MIRLLACEGLKLKRSRLVWLLVAGALLPAALNFVSAAVQSKSKPFIPWDSVFGVNLLFMAMFVCPMIFAVFTGYVFAREYQERTANLLLTSPRSRSALLAAKYAVLLPVILFMVGLSFLLSLATGFLLKHEPLTGAVLGEYAMKFVLLALTQFALVPMAVAVSLTGRSYFPAMGLCIFAIMTELPLLQTKYVMYAPWSAASNLLLDLNTQYNSPAAGAVTLMAAFLIPTVFNVVYFKRADVHSG